MPLPDEQFIAHVDTTLLHHLRRRPGSSASSEIPFRAFLDGGRPGWPELRIAYTVTRPAAAWFGSTGRIDGDFIRHYVDDLLGAMFFVCGAVGLVDALVDTLTRIGVDPVRIRQEGFPGYETNPPPASAAARLA